MISLDALKLLFCTVVNVVTISSVSCGSITELVLIILLKFKLCSLQALDKFCDDVSHSISFQGVCLSTYTIH